MATKLVPLFNADPAFLTPFTHATQIRLHAKSRLIGCLALDGLRRHLIHQPNDVACCLSPQIFGKATGMEEGSNVFNDGPVMSFCNTVMLGGMMNSEFLHCSL